MNPPKSAAPAPRKTDSKQPEHVNTDGGVLIHRVRRAILIPCVLLIDVQVVPDDNSCLFSSVALIFEQDIAKAPKLRESECLAVHCAAELTENSCSQWYKEGRGDL